MQHVTANGIVEAANIYLTMDCLMPDTTTEVWRKIPVSKSMNSNKITVFDTGRILLVKRADTGRMLPIIGFTEPTGVRVEIIKTKQWANVPNPSEIVTRKPDETCDCALEYYAYRFRVSAKKAELKQKFAELKGKRTSHKVQVKAWENRQQERLENAKSYYRRTTNDGSTPWMKYIPSEIMARLYAGTPELQNATTSKQAGRIWGRAIRRNRTALLNLMYGYDCGNETHDPKVWNAFNKFTLRKTLADIFTFEG